jgi:hypothetical protein
LVLGFQKKTSFRSFRVSKKDLISEFSGFQKKNFRFTVCSDNCKRVKKPIYINVDYLARVRGRREGERRSREGGGSGGMKPRG